VQQRLLEEKANEIKAAAEAKKNRRKRRYPNILPRITVDDPNLQDFLDGSDFHETEQEILDTDPIADLFPGMLWGHGLTVWEIPTRLCSLRSILFYFSLGERRSHSFVCRPGWI
jgi:hypothetical protein